MPKKFDLQFFADGDGTANGDGGNVSEPEKVFTQADLERIVKDRVDRVNKKYADYDELKQTRAALEAAGLSLEEIQEIRRKKEESAKAKESEPLKKDDHERAVAQYKAQLEAKQKEVAAKEAEIEQERKANREYRMETSAVSAISKHEGIPKLLLPHVMSSLLVEKVNGREYVRVVGEDGEPRLNKRGEVMTVDEFVSSLRDDPDFSRCFKGTGTTGSGTPANRGQGRAGAFVLSREDAGDPMKYRAAREAATRAGQELQIATE